MSNYWRQSVVRNSQAWAVKGNCSVPDSALEGRRAVVTGETRGNRKLSFSRPGAGGEIALICVQLRRPCRGERNAPLFSTGFTRGYNPSPHKGAKIGLNGYGQS
jgi:hypothetical protein